MSSPTAIRQGNHQSFIDLTRYKLHLLRASVDESKMQRAAEAAVTSRCACCSTLAI